MLERDGHACQFPEHGEICGRPANQVDHIVPNDDDSITNLRALCAWHHLRKSSSEGGQASASARGNRRRPDGPHPGLLPESSTVEGKIL